MAGSLLVVIAILMQASSNGLLSENLSGTESLLLSFTGFGIAALVFNLIAKYRRSRSREPTGRVFHGEALRLLVLVNIATAVTFLGFYWSLSLIPAPLAAAIETGIGPLAMACLSFRRAATADRVGGMIVGVLALGLALLVAGRTAALTEFDSTLLFVVGVVVAAIAGTSAACIALLSYRFGQLKVSPVDVTAQRFHLTYVLALVVLVFVPGPGVQAMEGSRIAFIAVIAVTGAALPLFILQIGMQRTAPVVVTLLASAVPSLTYIVATVAGGQGFDTITFLLINGSLAVAFLGPMVLNRLTKGKDGGGSPSEGDEKTGEPVEGQQEEVTVASAEEAHPSRS